MTASAPPAPPAGGASPIDLLIVGSVAYDTVETPAHTAERVLGGSASFIGATAAAWCRPGVVAVVGDDFRDEDVAFLRRAGVALDGLQQRAGKTFFWAGRYDRHLISRDTLATELGVFADFEPEIPAAWRSAPFVFLGNIAPSLQLRVLDQVEAPRFVGLDTMNFWIEGARSELDEVIARVDGLFCNDEEAELLTGHRSVLQAGRALQARGPRLVVIKRGEHGSLTFAGDDLFFAPAYPLEEVQDPTGAGDTFAGGFMARLAAGDGEGPVTLRAAAVLGTIMASFCVEGFSVDGLRAASPERVAERIAMLAQLVSQDGLRMPDALPRG